MGTATKYPVPDEDVQRPLLSSDQSFFHHSNHCPRCYYASDSFLITSRKRGGDEILLAFLLDQTTLTQLSPRSTTSEEMEANTYREAALHFLSCGAWCNILGLDRKMSLRALPGNCPLVKTTLSKPACDRFQGSNGEKRVETAAAEEHLLKDCSWHLDRRRLPRHLPGLAPPAWRNRLGNPV